MRKPVTLIAGQFGSRHLGTEPHLAAAMQLTSKDAPTALYVGAANGEYPSLGTKLCGLIAAAGAAHVVWPKLAARRPERAAARAALGAADFVLFGGGDVEAGMDVLRESDLVDELRLAAQRGVVFAGISAGAILLGERWVRWPHDEAGDHEAETFECLGVAPCSLDTHGEGDDWREARVFVAARAREAGRESKVYGIPSGGALIVGNGKMRARGAAVPVFVAGPSRAAHIEATLDAEA